MTVVILCSLLALHNAQRLAPVPLVDELMVRLGTDYVGAGNLFGAYMITYALASIPSGVLADRYDARRLVGAGAGLSLLGSTLFALAESYEVALAARLILGVAGGLLYVPAVRFVVSAFPAGRRGSVMGFMEAGVGVGQILALTVVPLLAARFDLTQAFLSLAVFAALALAGVALGLPAARTEASGGRGSGNMAGLVRNYGFWCLVAFHFLGMISIYALMAWTPTFFRMEFGFTAVEAGLVAALTSMGLAVFSPVAGAVSDKLGARTPVLLAGSALLVATLAVLMLVRTPWVAVAASGIAGVAVAFSIPVLVIMIGESFARYGPGLAVSIAGTAGQMAASLSGPLFGFTLEVSHSFVLVWGVALALGAVRVPFLIVGDNRTRRVKGVKNDAGW
jgi:DHA1 family inner membrane transport protein